MKKQRAIIVIISGIAIGIFLFLMFIFFTPSILIPSANILEKDVFALVETTAKTKSPSCSTSLEMAGDFIKVLEDRDFDTRILSFSIRGILRAVLTNMKSGKLKQGASGIPQQLVAQVSAIKLGYYSHKNWRFKIIQFIIASKLWWSYSRENIFDSYLSTIPCGPPESRGNSCSYYLFAKHLTELTPAETSILASQLRAPIRLQKKQQALLTRAQYAFSLLSEKYELPTGFPTILKDRFIAQATQQSSLCTETKNITRKMVIAKAISHDAILKNHSVVAGTINGNNTPIILGNTSLAYPSGSWIKIFLLRALEQQHALSLASEQKLPANLLLYDMQLRPWRPGSVGTVAALNLLEAIAVSHNQSTLTNYFYLGFANDSLGTAALNKLTLQEKKKYSSALDRQVTVQMLSTLFDFPFEQYGNNLINDFPMSYRGIIQGMTRLAINAARKDIPNLKTTDYPSALLGSETTATFGDWLRGLHNAFFKNKNSCEFTETGKLLAEQQWKRGTTTRLLKSLKQALPSKTGTTRNTAQIAVAYCDNGIPSVTAILVYNPSWEKITITGSNLAPLLAEIVEPSIKIKKTVARR